MTPRSPRKPAKPKRRAKRLPPTVSAPEGQASAALPEPRAWSTVTPDGWILPVGYANAVISRGGTLVSIAGQTAMGPDGQVLFPGDLVKQVGQAFDNVLAVLTTAGGRPDHLVRVRLYVKNAAEYGSRTKEIGAAWRARFGRWYPAMTLVQVARLYDPLALVEVEADAVVP